MIFQFLVHSWSVYRFVEFFHTYTHKSNEELHDCGNENDYVKMAREILKEYLNFDSNFNANSVKSDRKLNYNLILFLVHAYSIQEKFTFYKRSVK